MVTQKKGGKAIHIQNYLQDAFLGAVAKLVGTVGGLESVMGFEVGLESPSRV